MARMELVALTKEPLHLVPKEQGTNIKLLQVVRGIILPRHKAVSQRQLVGINSHQLCTLGNLAIQTIALAQPSLEAVC